MKYFLMFFFFSVMPIVSFSTPIVITQSEEFDLYYLADERVPTFHASIYFADGALSEETDKKGLSNAMFDLLENGTKQLTQEAIAGNLDQLGMSIKGSTDYEFSTLEFEGLVQSRVDTTKFVCEILKDSTFPASELKKFQTAKSSEIQNLVSTHGALIERVARQLFYEGSPLVSPLDGNLSSLKKLKTVDLKNQRDYFLNKVKKRVFLQGPKTVLDIVDILKKDCGFAKDAKFVRSEVVKNLNIDRINPLIYFIPLPKANQAQIRMSRVQSSKAFQGLYEQNQLTSSLLGGSFTSLLMQEVRVKRGLTYSISANSPSQSTFGRSVISSFSRNEGVVDTINAIKQVTDDLCSGKVASELIEGSKKYLKGSQLVSFDDTKAYLSMVTSYYHKGRTLEDITLFPSRIESVSKDQIVDACKRLYFSGTLTTAVLGDQSLKEKLEKAFGVQNVKTVKYEDYL
ncbi:MAG: insulinase family protein [Bacteriovoracaceae bacterium]|nr:insulinase family protein [Bacteriovoracaceae bacterium]